MRKILILFLAVFFLQYAGFGQEADEARTAEIKDQIVRINKEVERLQGKLAKAESEAKRSQLSGIIEGHHARLEKLQKELSEISKPKIEEVPKFLEEEVVTPEVRRIAEDKAPRFKFEIGGLVGLFANASTLIGEIRFPLHFIFGPATTALRLSGGYAQSEDAGRRYATLYLDGILKFPPGVFSGVENYLGAGLNYVVLTTGRVPGTFGGQMFYGVESEGFGGRVFGEMGYGILRTGFSPSHKGITVLVGYRREWGF